jgi:hypothetical protein
VDIPLTCSSRKVCREPPEGTVEENDIVANPDAKVACPRATPYESTRRTAETAESVAPSLSTESVVAVASAA